MPNVWKAVAVGKDGKEIEFAPGMKSVVLRGPGTKAEATMHVNMLLNAMRRKHWQQMSEKLEVTIKSVEPIADNPVSGGDFGVWQPPEEAKQIDLMSTIPAHRRPDADAT